MIILTDLISNSKAYIDEQIDVVKRFSVPVICDGVILRHVLQYMAETEGKVKMTSHTA
jgi:hypothetical protein